MPTAVDSLYESSLTLRLLCAKNAPLVLGFSQEAFKERNQHAIGEEELELLLDRHLADHVVLDGEVPAENRAKNYLNLWCSYDYCYVRERFEEVQRLEPCRREALRPATVVARCIAGLGYE